MLFDFLKHAEEMHDAATAAEAEGPGSMMEVLRSFETMPETLEHIAAAFDVVVARCDDALPLHADVTAEVESVRALIRQAASASESIATTFRARHEHDIARHEDPRNGEELWDVGPGGPQN